ncbi:MAG: long-chain fatty acid--CoA ligase [Acidobacteriota bacterium]|nr:long-chain fatty acid--CoA ligase [Acidobacteriota bacterium]
MKEIRTVNDAFLLLSSRGDKPAWQWYTPQNEWKPITSAEVYGCVRALATTLAGWGIGRGDRVAMIAENRWEWPVIDFAALALGAVDVPLYPTLPPEQIGYMLRDSGARAVFVSTRELYNKVRAAGAIPELEHIVVMDPGEYEGALTFASLMTRAESMQEPDAAFDALAAQTGPDDLATIIYTSGTTGEPKGVALTHGNLASNFTLSTVPFGFGERDRCLSFLPLSHVTARHLDYALMLDGATLAYCPRLDLLPGALKAIQPTIFVAVPRVYERFRQTIESRAKGTKKKIMNWAIGVGHRNRAAILAGRVPASPLWKLARTLVFAKIAEAFGGKVEVFVSGGAPLGVDTAGWFADVGVRILEGYGLTETSPVIALNLRDRYRLGTVGPVLANVELRFAEDGELEVRGASVFKGYWNKPDESRAAFTADGWFATGDIGKLEDGFLSITDRKKELIKSSGGKFIAPQPIENKLKADLLVGNAALVGDKRKFVGVLLSPNFVALERWAAENDVAAASRADLVREPKVLAEYRALVKRINATLAPFERIKGITLVPDEWTVESGELTPSMKLKRRIVEAKYRTEIGEMYRDDSA